jgi:hypothetical protein
MGIDFRDLTVSIPGHCGMRCLVPVVEELLVNGTDVIAAKQRNISKFISLFSYGMEHNAMKHVDAVAAILVQARHYINML